MTDSRRLSPIIDYPVIIVYYYSTFILGRVLRLRCFLILKITNDIICHVKNSLTDKGRGHQLGTNMYHCGQA